MKKLHVIGNRIKNHVDIGCFISVNDFFAVLQEKNKTDCPVKIVIGQGVSIEDRLLLIEKINNTNSYFL